MAAEDSGKTQWHELYHEVVETNPCTVELSTAADDCSHGQRGCDICTRACPRFRDWEVESDQALFGRPREAGEVSGIERGVYLVRAAEPEVLERGQDGGLVSALLIWGLETGRIEGALTSRLSGTRLWDCEPFLATTREEVLEAAGSRYTYAANPLAMKDAERRGLKRLALVGMSCQASVNGTLEARRVNKYARRIELVIGLLCSKSFEYEGMRQIITEEYGIPLEDVAKVNIKGKFQVWRRSTGEEIDIPLKKMQDVTRQGCKLCPDFAAEHADIATGGLGQTEGWTLTIVRTGRGQDWLEGAVAAGLVTARPGEEDPAALALLAKLAVRSRRRWPVEAGAQRFGSPGMLPLAEP